MKFSLRNILAYLFANILILLGFVRRAKRRVLNRECILSIYCHKPTRSEFESCIRWLKANGFTFVSIQELEKIIYNEMPFPKGGVLLTVDDGWQTNEPNVVEVANKYEVPVTIFVSTAPIEQGNFWWSYVHKAKQIGKGNLSKKQLKKLPDENRALQIDEIKRSIFLEREALTISQVVNMANSKYITIGGHTHNHPILINCSNENAFHELDISKQKLESWTNKVVSCFSFPNGDYSAREIKILKELNYKLAFTTEAKYLTPDKVNNIYKLPRFLFLEGASFAENICRMVGVWQLLTNKCKPIMLVSKKRKTQKACKLEVDLN